MVQSGRRCCRDPRAVSQVVDEDDDAVEGQRRHWDLDDDGEGRR